MADDKQNQKKGPSIGGYYKERARVGLINRLISGFFGRFGAKRQPQISKEGKAETPDIRRELASEFEKNRNLLKQLRVIETDWNFLDDFIWKEEAPQSLVNLYKKVSYLVDPVEATNEAKVFREGTGVRDVSIPWDIGTPQNPESVNIETKELTPKKFYYIEPDGDVIEEEFSIIGYNNARQFIGVWETQYSNWLSKVQNNAQLAQALTGLINLMHDTVNPNISQYTKEIINREHGFHKDKLAPNVTITKTILAARGQLDKSRPKNVRFFHTYKIIAPVIRNPQYDPNNTQCLQTLPNGRPNPQYNPNARVCKPLLYFKDEYSTFKRPDEVEAGKDENGYPLEVYEDTNGQWKILMDRWWSEIASNEWQKKLTTEDQFIFEGITYKGKGNKGGRDIWQAKVVNGIGAVPPYNIRAVPNSAFVKDLDILEMATYIYNEFDSYRDDLRDGRYHLWSKTTTDYVMAAEGISTKDYRTFGTLPYSRGLTSFVPKAPIPLSYYPMSDYVSASPNTFLSVPNDERLVTRDFHMKCNVTLPNDDQTPGLPDNILAGERKPTALNPAFDRRAMTSKSDVGQDRFFIHWGRMYYYEDTIGINKWSENPFPQVSTRGIAKWMIYRILMDLPWEQAVKAAKNDDGYDYGIRRPLVGGEFIKDPLGATDLISKNPLY